jgi:hypothetical protein
LGTYEKELHVVFKQIIGRRYGFIVDIGAAEGFYAVGLALKAPEARVIAFETTETGRKLLAQASARNGVAGRIEIRGHCRPEDLARELQGATERSLVICDAEGEEVALLDPECVPQLKHCDILAELHPWAVDDPKGQILRRFEPFAEVLVFRASPRTADEFPSDIPVSISRKGKLACLDERRPPEMEWVWIQPFRSKAVF